MIKHYSPISNISVFLEKYIATAGYDNRLILWDAKTHQSISVGFHDHLVNQCVFSPDGEYLLSSSSDFSARLWKVPEMKLLTIFNAQQDDSEGLSFHPINKLVAVTSRDHHTYIYDYSGTLLHKLSGHEHDVLSVVWCKNNELITSSDDGTVRRWNSDTGKEIEKFSLDEIETDTIAISKEGVIFSGNDEGKIIIIQNKECIHIQAHQSGVKCLYFYNELNMLLSLSYDRTAHLWKWDPLFGKLDKIQSTNLPPIVWARSANFLGNSQIVFSTFGSQYAIYDRQTNEWITSHISDTHGINAVLAFQSKQFTVGDSGKLYCNQKLQVELPSLCNFLVSVDDDIITGGQTGSLFSGFSGEVIYQHHSPLNCACMFYKNNIPHVIIGTYTGDAVVLKKQNKKYEFVTYLQLFNNAIKGISSSLHEIFAVCATGDACFYSIETLSEIKYVPDAHDEICNGCAWYDEGIFVSVGRDLTLRFTNLYEQTVLETPHMHSIKCVYVSSDKRYIATGGYRGLLAIYDTINKKWLSSQVTHAGISCISFNSEKNKFLISSYDGRIYYSNKLINFDRSCEIKKISEINIKNDREAIGLPSSFVASKNERTNLTFCKLRNTPIKELIEISESLKLEYKLRYTAAQYLALLGDPRINPEYPFMISIPEADVMIGIHSDEVENVLSRHKNLVLKREWIEKETPQFKVHIPAFKMRKYLVTNEEYKLFLKETEYNELPSSWEFGIYPEYKANHPVYTVTEQAAEAYAVWISKKTNRKFRLPTEFEWEYAASGLDHFEFPWGNKFSFDHANINEEGIYTSTPVGIFAKGYSPFGLADMAGNVEEYVADNYRPYQGGLFIKDDLLLNRENYRVCRGGSFTRYSDLARNTRRHGRYNKAIYVIGFRLVEEI